jgi:uncharacterized protein YbcI
VALASTLRSLPAMSEASQEPLRREEPTGVLSEISNAMVRVLKEQFGRGPTKARSYWSGDDVIVSVLEDSLVPAERNLLKMGEHQRLRDTRLFFEYASTREICEPIERITGRRVRAHVSGIDTEADGVVIETFLLHPRGYDGPSRIERAEP